MQLRTAIREKRRGKLSKGVLLQQDNARVHTCKVAMDAVDTSILLCGKSTTLQALNTRASQQVTSLSHFRWTEMVMIFIPCFNVLYVGTKSHAYRVIF